MLRDILFALTRPVAWPLARGLDLLMTRRLGRRGMLELVLDHRTRPLIALRDLERVMEITNVRGLILNVRDIAWGWADLAEWREAMIRFRAAGHLVLATFESTGNGGYYLASAADRVLMVPGGELGLMGVGGAMTFFGPALKKLGLRFEVESAGAYKSFGETFTRGYASPENREAMEALIDDLHEELVRSIAESRRMEPEAVQALIDKAPLLAEEALEAGLVDKLGFFGAGAGDAVEELLTELLGGDFNRVDAVALERTDRWTRRLDGFLSSDPRVAVLHLKGPVVMGEVNQGGRARISAREVPAVLNALAADPRVAAVVLAVDSPGGSALASDIIWRGISRLVQEKPVVASLGNVAASGGYYMAAAANEIVARPSTMTGSIGVVGGKLVIGPALARLGVHTEMVARGRNVGMESARRGFDPEQRARFRERLKHTYALFIKRVSTGRRRPAKAIEEVAQGRVWSGKAALEGELVDHLGGLAQAVERARSLATLRQGQPWRRVDVTIRPPGSRLMRLARRQMAGVSAAAPEGVAGMLLSHPNQPMAMLPFDADLGATPPVGGLLTGELSSLQVLLGLLGDSLRN